MLKYCSTTCLLLITLATLARCNVLFAQEATTEASPFAMPESDDAFPGEGPVRRFDWFQRLWESKRSVWSKAVDSDQQSVVFFGDSITQGWNDDFRGFFPELKKANRGLSGDTTRGMLYRLQDDVLQLNPTCIVILAGTNDLEEGADPQTIVTNVDLILQKITNHKPDLPVILCAIFPSSEKKKRPAEQIKAVNTGLMTVAASRPQVMFLDTWSLFADATENAKPIDFPDLLHPNASGYSKWQRQFDHYLQRSVSSNDYRLLLPGLKVSNHFSIIIL